MRVCMKCVSTLCLGSMHMLDNALHIHVQVHVSLTDTITQQSFRLHYLSFPQNAPQTQFPIVTAILCPLGDVRGHIPIECLVQLTTKGTYRGKDDKKNVLTTYM